MSRLVSLLGSTLLAKTDAFGIEPGGLADTVIMIVVVTLCVVLFSVLAFLGYLVWRDTKRGYGRWGVNRHPIHCPRCEEPAPMVRIAANWRQFFWGGATCSRCGCEYDKWGKPVDLPELDAGDRFQPRPAKPPAPPPENVQPRPHQSNEEYHA
jgi:hypothetical protein